MHHDNSIVPCPEFMWTPNNRVGWLMQQNSIQEHVSSHMHINTIQSITNNFNLSSWCLPQICWQLRFLNAFQTVANFFTSSSRDIWKLWTSSQAPHHAKHVWQVCAMTQETTRALRWSQNPPFQDNSKLQLVPIRHGPLLNSQSNQITLRRSLPCKANEEWTSSSKAILSSAGQVRILGREP